MQVSRPAVAQQSCGRLFAFNFSKSQHSAKIYVVGCSEMLGTE